eukprot:Blabericola_migrator_1__1630@NODE_1437_length_4551_cov_80_907672_g376_i1_p3_GENE_NODE_1437_length_4551_cov_80_907672_g376_i1NODE_1437_length_4551_cov_80_907672_g376_i1_p3_ORF_typecomplete_len223_score50_02RMI1_N/PF08585_12/3_5e07_NODE_1437_length_4551_cov_80_907672_g376_i128083476
MDAFGIRVVDGLKYEGDISRAALLNADLRQLPIQPQIDALAEAPKQAVIHFPGCLLLQLVKFECLSSRASAIQLEEDDDAKEDFMEVQVGKGRMKYTCACGKLRLHLFDASCFPVPSSKELVPGSKLLLRGSPKQKQLDIVNGFILLHHPSQIEWVGGQVESQLMAFEVSKKVTESRKQEINQSKLSRFIPFGKPKPPIAQRLVRLCLSHTVTLHTDTHTGC